MFSPKPIVKGGKLSARDLRRSFELGRKSEMPAIAGGDASFGASGNGYIVPDIPEIFVAKTCDPETGEYPEYDPGIFILDCQEVRPTWANVEEEAEEGGEEEESGRDDYTKFDGGITITAKLKVFHIGGWLPKESPILVRRIDGQLFSWGELNPAQWIQFKLNADLTAGTGSVEVTVLGHFGGYPPLSITEKKMDVDNKLGFEGSEDGEGWAAPYIKDDKKTLGYRIVQIECPTDEEEEE